MEKKNKVRNSLLDELKKGKPSNGKKVAALSEGIVESSDVLDKDEIIYLEPNEFDDFIVAALKEYINQRRLTSKELSLHEDYDYNLIYGLRTRRTIKSNSFQKWLNILNAKVSIRIVSNKDGI
jgi:hypothetical protein